MSPTKHLQLHAQGKPIFPIACTTIAVIMLAISYRLQVLITIKTNKTVRIFSTWVKLRYLQLKLFRWISFSLSTVVLCLLLFASTSRFCSSRSKIFSTLSSYRIRRPTPFRNRSTSFSVGLPRVACAFVFETSVYICYLPAGGSVWWQTVTEVLKILPKAVFLDYAVRYYLRTLSQKIIRKIIYFPLTPRLY